MATSLSKTPISIKELETQFDPGNPPPGIRYQNTPSGISLGISHRSLPQALVLLAINLFWNGILLFFLAFACAATLKLLQWPAPAFLPEPIMNGKPMGPGETTVVWLFLLPFMLIGLALFIGLLSSLAGQTRIRINEKIFTLFQGIGPIGWSRKFPRHSINKVSLSLPYYLGKGGRLSQGNQERMKQEIEVTQQDGKILRLGGSLKKDQRNFLAVALHRHLSLS